MPLNSTGPGKIIFVISVFVSAFWVSGELVNISEDQLFGTVFEFLWIPMLGMAVTLPLISFVLWTSVRFNLRSVHFYSFAISATTMYLLLRTVNLG